MEYTPIPDDSHNNKEHTLKPSLFGIERIPFDKVREGAEAVVVVRHPDTGKHYPQRVFVQQVDRENESAIISYKSLDGESVTREVPFYKIYKKSSLASIEHINKTGYVGFLEKGAKASFCYVRGGISYIIPCEIVHYDDINNIVTIRFHDSILGRDIEKECTPEDLLTD